VEPESFRITLKEVAPPYDLNPGFDLGDGNNPYVKAKTVEKLGPQFALLRIPRAN
jgi:hypothetical protein